MHAGATLPAALPSCRRSRESLLLSVDGMVRVMY